MNRDGLGYVKALLDAAAGSIERRIAERVWTLSMSTRDEVLEYLTHIMTDHPCESRAFEVAYEIWLLMGGRGVAAA